MGGPEQFVPQGILLSRSQMTLMYGIIILNILFFGPAASVLNAIVPQVGFYLLWVSWGTLQIPIWYCLGPFMNGQNMSWYTFLVGTYTTTNVILFIFWCGGQLYKLCKLCRSTTLCFCANGIISIVLCLMKQLWKIIAAQPRAPQAPAAQQAAPPRDAHPQQAPAAQKAASLYSQADLEGMNYRDLQKACKINGLSAGGKIPLLCKRPLSLKK